MNRFLHFNLRNKFFIGYFLLLLITVFLSIGYIGEYISLEMILVFFIQLFGFISFFKMLMLRTFNPLEPKSVIPITYAFYALGPLFYKADFSEGTIIYYLLLQLIGLMGLKFGLFFQKSTDKSKIKATKNYSNKIILSTGVITLILSVLSIYTEIKAFGSLGQLLSIGYGGDRFLLISKSTIIGGSFSWLLLSGIIFWYYGLKGNSKKNILFGIGIYLIAFIILLLIGGRSSIVYSILFFIVLYYYERKKISNKLIFFGLLIGIIFSQFYSYARFYLPNGFGIAMTETLGILVNNPELFYPWATSEFKEPGKSLLEIIEYGGPGLQFGKSYLTALGNTLPFLGRFTEKIGFNPSVWLLKTYHNDTLAAGGGNGFSPVTEGYINFGVIGVFLHMFIYGFVISKIYNHFVNKGTVASLLLFAGALPVFMLDGLRIHLGSFMYKLLRINLFPFFIFIILVLVKKEVVKKIILNK